MKFRVERGGLNRLEHSIAPPMRMVITIPVVAEMGARGADIIVYVCTSPFGQRGVETSSMELTAIAKEIADRIDLSIPPDNVKYLRHQILELTEGAQNMRHGAAIAHLQAIERVMKVFGG
jgi:deoxyribose-phosphate aldolase